MNSILGNLFHFTPSPLWSSKTPVREELFGIERLEQHAQSLASAQTISKTPPRVSSLHKRLDDTAKVLLAAYQASAFELENGRSVVPAAEWLLDNYHLVEQHIREIRIDLPLGFYRQLPKLATGPFTGYPRVFGLAWAYVAHTDSHFDPENLRRFLIAYQQVVPLTIGELWAVSITIRFVLIENLRRLADQMTAGRSARADADAFADALLTIGCGRSALEADIASRNKTPLFESFAAQLTKRLRDQDPNTTPALSWLQERLALQNTNMDDVVLCEQQRQGASNLTLRNVITSMRLISSIDWSELFESVSMVNNRLLSANHFADMDFSTRNLYRCAIEQLARGSDHSELEVTEIVLTAALTAGEGTDDPNLRERLSDPGFHLIAEGRRALEKTLGFSPSARLRLNRFSIQLGIGGYVSAILMVASLLVAGSLVAMNASLETKFDHPLTFNWLVLFAFLGFLPATDFATGLVNRLVTLSFGALTLPGLELKNGVPSAMRTLVVVPTLLTSAEDLLEQIERLEVHYLSGAEGDISFALLTDGLDAQTENTPEETRLLTLATTTIADLNLQYPSETGVHRFLLLHRRRQFNPSENLWMGWERKRGKLHELNRLLRGATDTSFIASDQPIPTDVRYVITLDADTRLPRNAALRMIGKMGHPLNRPRFSEDQQRVVDGYGILQPRVTASLPLGREGSVYQRVFSSPGGMDPYSAAVSDVYQDLFGEGSYTGKGIYDVDAFEASLAGRIPENRMLSHDLFEGIFARAGLASDIEVVEEFPSRYDVAAKRQHRWTRGDWQLLPWIFCGIGKIPLIGRFKMLDNIRRSLLTPFAFATLAFCWLLPLPAAIIGSLLVMGALILPTYLPFMFAIMPPRTGVSFSNHLDVLLADIKLAAMQAFFSVAFLPDQAWRMMDAILRSLFRVMISRRKLLEWTTAAQSKGSPRLDLRGFYRQMAASSCLGMVMAGIALWVNISSWSLILPFVILWLSAPAIALWSSRSSLLKRRLEITDQEAKVLRHTARRTWRYFETFVTASDNFLPPDNFQNNPTPTVAHRTSPTNMGLYLLSTLAARDFAWIDTDAMIERLEATLASMNKLVRFKGHFYNWYETTDLRPLEPAYVSSVDSGNLAGHLLVLANACEVMSKEMKLGSLNKIKNGIMDSIELARDAIENFSVVNISRKRQLSFMLDDIETQLNGSLSMDELLPIIKLLSNKTVKTTDSLINNLLLNATDSDGTAADLDFWIQALNQTITQHCREYSLNDFEIANQNHRLQNLANNTRQMALSMDFAFLLDPNRKLLSIGYSLADNCLDPSCYDLLASEARLASLFAIAKGDVSTKHWFRLGRAATPLGKGSALISWSGSMFEYLMPSLVMRAPVGSLLEQTNRLVVARQEDYATSLNLPWGISESAYNARDIELTYQYSNFGVPGLGLKRGLAENLVIAPYATGLATMIDPQAACINFKRLAELGALGRYGFYEALDFTRTRLPDNQDVAIVFNFMAHHQGMTIVAIANTLLDGIMRERFHREPMIKACELLLQERLPRNVAIAHPRAEEVRSAASDNSMNTPTLRRLQMSLADANTHPVTHLLSNGRYAVMLTAAGGGYSRWRDIAITRWREDATCDPWGSFIFLRDTQSGKIWSPSTQPVASDLTNSDENLSVTFAEDNAEFVHQSGKLTTTMNVMVSGEDDAEVRRISLTNTGRRGREVELTSYAELVLTSTSNDDAHPAFAKMFVQTEYLAEYGALIATRRPRSSSEEPIWAAHFAVVEGELNAAPQFESDRARFIGRSRSIATAAAILDDVALTNSAGTVLDPIFSLRLCVKVPAGEIARVAFWTLVASSRKELLTLIDKHLDPSAFDRAQTLAWTQAQVQLRHLNIDAEEAANFQRLAAPILYTDKNFRPSVETIQRGSGKQSGLWLHGISGDLPIVLLRIDDIEDIAQVRQLLRAHEYWRIKRLAVDLVIINERTSSYLQDLQIAIETAARSKQSLPGFNGGKEKDRTKGSVFTLRSDLMSMEIRQLLLSVARVSLVAQSGNIATQLARLPKIIYGVDGRSTPYITPKIVPKLTAQLEKLGSFSGFERRSSKRTDSPEQEIEIRQLFDKFAHLEFFNGLGGFDKNGREYVTLLTATHTTPAPWINIIANPRFGFQVSTGGAGYTWAENSRENQITQWSNDPVSDPGGEVFYLRDEETLEIWSPTAQPIRDKGHYVARHGFGYSSFEHQANGIASELLQFVPLTDSIKISRLTLRNLSGRSRQLSLTFYNEWVLGTSRGASASYIISQVDSPTNALLAWNPWNIAFAGRVAFADLMGEQSSWTADRTEFLGRNTSTSSPAALASKNPLSGAMGAGLDPCAALQQRFTLAAGESIELVACMGQAPSAEAASQLISLYRKKNLDLVLQEVTQHWDKVLGAVQVKTPERSMDILLNGWLLYQTIVCRIWARSAFYQASGAYGFRDQLQDGMALTFSQPETTRGHILRAAGRQFVEGDLQHWWLPHSGQGVRTHISDDRVWLAFATATYIITSGDTAILDEKIPFLEGQLLAEGEHDAFFQPMQSSESASLFDHCAKALNQCLQLTGKHGLPLMGTGDWNDGMNRVGEGGKGESVWLGWFLVRTIDIFAPIAEARADAVDAQHAQHWRAHATNLKVALEAEAWDGDWYRRATYDDGSWLGSKESDECNIDSIAQTWAVLSGADPVRAATAMASLESKLIRPNDGIALLFTPPFNKTTHEPGYIKGYPPGLRENGGQYTHAAIWAIFAFAKLGNGKKASELFNLINPINHTLTPKNTDIYKVEPYVIAADVYSVAPHIGRGGWTWYTGSAGWMYRAGVEGILGIRREGKFLIIDPCIPITWEEFEAKINVFETQFTILVKMQSQNCQGISSALLDDKSIPLTAGSVRVELDGNQHSLLLTI